MAGTNISTTSNSIQNDGTAKTPSNEILLSKALEAESIEAAIPLFLELKLHSIPIVEEHFLPLISAQNDTQSILSIIDIMQKEFNIQTLSSPTIRRYIVPKLAGHQTVDELMIVLEHKIGCKSNVAATSCVYHYLSVGQWDSALRIANTYDIFYSPKLFRNVLINAFYLTKDVKNFATFVHIICNSMRHTEKLRTVNVVMDPKAVLGDIIYETVQKFSGTQQENVLKEMLVEIMARGLSISIYQCKRIENLLHDNANTEMTQLLSVLSDGVLKPVEMTKDTNCMLSNVNANTKNLIEQSIKNKMATSNQYNSLLEIYYNEKNGQQFADLIRLMENDGKHVSNGYYAKLIAIKMDNVDEALQIYRNVRKERSDFKLRISRQLFVIVSHLLKNNRFDEAIQILTENRSTAAIDGASTKYEESQTKWWSLLNVLALEGRANEVDRLFDVLIENNYVLATSVTLGPLVSVHLVNDDLRKAVDTFERIATRYNATPWRNQLMRRLIENDQVADLQRIVDLSSKRHGDIKTLYALSFAFVEGGRKVLAKQVIERLGSRIDPQMYNNQFRYYLDKDQIDYLKAFFEITKGISYFQRDCLYNSLLDYYCKTEQSDAVLDLWKERIDEGLPLCTQFLTPLAEFIAKHNVKLPFEIPQSEKEAFAATAAQGTNTPSKWPNTSWALVEKLVHENQLEDACSMLEQLLIKKRRINTRTFHYVMGKIALSGRCDLLASIGAHLTVDQKKEFTFDNRLCVAFNKAGQGLQFIEKLEEQIVNCQTGEEIKNVGRHFPLVSHCILEDKPELSERCK